MLREFLKEDSCIVDVSLATEFHNSAFLMTVV